MEKNKKVVFLTAHNWDSKRLGGFHKFAEACCEQGYQTVFFSFPRPYYSYFQHSELFNSKSIKALKKGIYYDVKESKLLNITLPTLKLPNKAEKILPVFFLNFLERFSFYGFSRFAKKYFKDTDVFVFESCDGIIFVDKIWKMFPDSKIIYRPSDPMMYDKAPKRQIKNEMNMLHKADLIINVNEVCANLYKQKVHDYDKLNCVILPNGVDIEPFTKKYDKPDLLKKTNTALYIGAWDIEWNLIFTAAKECPDFNFIIVNPNSPKSEVLEQLLNYSNIFYVPGIKPAELPQWITNCEIFMVPYPTNFYKDRPMSITAKYYQAMATGKPIISYHNDPEIGKTGAIMTYSYEEFIEKLKDSASNKTINYTISLFENDWKTIKSKFVQFLS